MPAKNVERKTMEDCVLYWRVRKTPPPPSSIFISFHFYFRSFPRLFRTLPRPLFLSSQAYKPRYLYESKFLGFFSFRFLFFPFRVVYFRLNMFWLAKSGVSLFFCLRYSRSARWGIFLIKKRTVTETKGWSPIVGVKPHCWGETPLLGWNPIVTVT